MASEQMRRENTTSEREVEVEKDKVPKIACQFESMTVHVTPLDSAAKDSSPDDHSARSGNKVGDVGRGKAREAHQIGSHHFESLKDSVKGEADKGGRGGDRREEEKDRQRESVADRARTANMVADKAAEEGRQGREQSGPHMQGVGKFEVTRGTGEEEEEKGSKGREGGASHEMMARRGQSGPNQGRGQSRPQHQGVGKVEVMRAGDEEKGREGTKGRGTDQESGRGGGSGSEQMRSRSEEGHGHEHIRGSPTEMKMESNQSRNENKELQQQQQQQQQKQQPSLEEVSKFRGEAQQNSVEVLRAAEERYAKAKESAKQGLSSATELATEKGAAAKDTLASAAKTAGDYTAPVAEKAKGAARTAVDYTAPVAEKAKGAAKTAADYTAPVAGKAKDAAVSAGQTTMHYAGDVAVDLKDKATVAGWTAAYYTTEIAVEGTKAAAKAVKGAAEYAGHKAVEIAAVPLGAARDAAVVTGEKVEDYTARKKEEAWREYQAKRSADQRMGTDQKSYRGDQEEGMFRREQDKSWSLADENIFWDQDVEKSREDRNVQREGGRPTAESQNMMTSKEGSQQGEGLEGEVTGVLGAIGETLVEIAQTTKDMVIGHGEEGQTGMEESAGGGNEWSSTQQQQQQQQGKQGQQTKQYGN